LLIFVFCSPRVRFSVAGATVRSGAGAADARRERAASVRDPDCAAARPAYHARLSQTMNTGANGEMKFLARISAIIVIRFFLYCDLEWLIVDVIGKNMCELVAAVDIRMQIEPLK
jgi:hypothetical protein